MYPRPNPTEKAINDAPSAIGLRPDKNPNVSECSTSMCGVWIPNDSSRYSVKRWCIPSSADNPIIPIPIVNTARIPYGIHIDFGASCMW